MMLMHETQVESACWENQINAMDRGWPRWDAQWRVLCKLQRGTGENSIPRSTSPPSTSPDLASLGVKSTPSERQVLRADMLDPAEGCWLNEFARKDWKYFFNLASGAQGWQREDAEQEAGEGFPAPRLVPFLGRRCGRRGESVWHSKAPLRHVLTGSSDGRYPSLGWGAMHDALRREIPA